MFPLHYNTCDQRNRITPYVFKFLATWWICGCWKLYPGVCSLGCRWRLWSALLANQESFSIENLRQPTSPKNPTPTPFHLRKSLDNVFCCWNQNFAKWTVNSFQIPIKCIFFAFKMGNGASNIRLEDFLPFAAHVLPTPRFLNRAWTKEL